MIDDLVYFLIFKELCVAVLWNNLYFHQLSFPATRALEEKVARQSPQVEMEG